MKMTYSEKLTQPEWQSRRNEILTRDGFACVCCGEKGGSLSVHHSYYVSGREPWQYPNWALRSLCSDCHGVEHSDPPCPLDWELQMELLTKGDPQMIDPLWPIFQEVDRMIKATNNKVYRLALCDFRRLLHHVNKIMNPSRGE